MSHNIVGVLLPEDKQIDSNDEFVDFVEEYLKNFCQYYIDKNGQEIDNPDGYFDYFHVIQSGVIDKHGNECMFLKIKDIDLEAMKSKHIEYMMKVFECNLGTEENRWREIMHSKPNESAREYGERMFQKSAYYPDYFTDGEIWIYQPEDRDFFSDLLKYNTERYFCLINTHS